MRLRGRRTGSLGGLLVALASIAGCGISPGDVPSGPSGDVPCQSLNLRGFIEVNGAQLYYEARGAAGAMSKTPIVLVHGLSLDSSMWDAQFGAMAEQAPTYRFDMRGHGLSSPVDGPVALHDDLLGFLDALGIARAHLVGLSLGGNAVTELAVAHPERVERLVLIDSGINGFDYPTPNVLQRIPAYLALNEEKGRRAALEAWLKDPLFAFSYESMAVRGDLERILLECPCSLFFNPGMQVRPDTFSRLHLVRAPTLVLLGAFDTNEFQAAGRALHERISGSTLRTIAAAGHMSNMDNPGAVLDAISEFLRS